MRGFSLIELMVVICIIAVLASVMSIGVMPGEGALADREARRLALLLEAAVAEARASGQGIAWTPEARGYAFLHRGAEGEWLPFPDSSPYRRRSFEGSVAIEGERVTLAPYGLQAPLQATIRGGDARIILRSGALGRISIERLHAD